MAIQRYESSFAALPQHELAKWKTIPAAVASDCMNRIGAMQSTIKPLVPGQPMCGQARTVTAMVGDCSAICLAAADCKPGEILVVDAGGYEDTAVWGGIMTHAAVVAGLGGVVVDGAVRDVAAIRGSGLQIFCRAIVPRGPHEGFGGVIDGAVSVAGVPVQPGDVVLGDDDGVVIVPLAHAPRILEAALRHIEKEEDWLRHLSAGKTIPEIFSMPQAKTIS